MLGRGRRGVVKIQTQKEQESHQTVWKLNQSHLLFCDKCITIITGRSMLSSLNHEWKHSEHPAGTNKIYPAKVASAASHPRAIFHLKGGKPWIKKSWNWLKSSDRFQTLPTAVPALPECPWIFYNLLHLISFNFTCCTKQGLKMLMLFILTNYFIPFRGILM